MAPSPRRDYSPAEELDLLNQVEGRCPRCGVRLFYEKKSRRYKGYELAHIFPLNPTPKEEEELKDVVLLNPDVNHPDNIIPLCTRCHPRFDKPRTREEYEELAQLKMELIRRAALDELNREFPLEREIQQIIESLNMVDFPETANSDLGFEAKSLDEKFDESIPGPMQRKIRHAVTDYYQHIRHEFRELELETPTASEVIYSQVKTYYLKQKKLGRSKPEIFSNVVNWIRLTTSSQSLEAAEIVASFFVQNCEVFE